VIDRSVDVDTEAAFLEEVKRIALDAAAGMNCEIFLFGSRAAGDIRRSSDFDRADARFIEMAERNKVGWKSGSHT
jgi:hypothetical protein